MPDIPRGHAAVKAFAARLGVPVTRLRVLSENHDPFTCGTPAHVRDAEWFTRLWQRFDFVYGVHLRRIHYVFVSQAETLTLPDGRDYENTEPCYNRLNIAAAYARHLGLIDPAAFDDRRNPDPFLLAQYADPLTYSNRPWWGLNEEEWRPWLLPQIHMAFDGGTFPMPEAWAGGYDYDLRDQPHHVEFWVEKSTMNDVLEPICRELGVNLVTGVGFQSITGVIRLLQRLISRRPTRVLYGSDFDPSGVSMPVAVARMIEFYRPLFAPDYEVKLTPVVLTEEQVNQYQLPRSPIRESNLGKATFEELRGGEGATELDALEALRPGELGRLVREAIEPYRDLDLEDRLEDADLEANRLVRKVWTKAVKAQRQTLDEVSGKVNTIKDKYRQRMEDLDREMQAELAPLKATLDGVRDAVTARAATLEIALPERPEAELGLTEGDEDDWLFDSGRDFCDQVNHFQRYQKKPTLDDLDRTCVVCGETFTASRDAQTLCGDRCRDVLNNRRKKQQREVRWMERLTAKVQADIKAQEKCDAEEAARAQAEAQARAQTKRPRKSR